MYIAHICIEYKGDLYIKKLFYQHYKIKSNQIKSNQIKSNQIKSNQIKSLPPVYQRFS